MNLWQSRPEAVWREQVLGRPPKAKAITTKRPGNSTARASAQTVTAKADARRFWEHYYQLLGELAANTATFKL